MAVRCESWAPIHVGFPFWPRRSGPLYTPQFSGWPDFFVAGSSGCQSPSAPAMLVLERIGTLCSDRILPTPVHACVLPSPEAPGRWHPLSCRQGQRPEPAQHVPEQPRESLTASTAAPRAPPPRPAACPTGSASAPQHGQIATTSEHSLPFRQFLSGVLSTNWTALAIIRVLICTHT